MKGKCPHCDSTNLSTEPVYSESEEFDYGYDEQNDRSDQVAVFCVTCGHFLGTFVSDLRRSSRQEADNLSLEYFRGSIPRTTRQE